jgi:predicted dehydrogenase
MRMYKALLFGLGNIAWRFDATDRQHGGAALTHAQALHAHHRVRIAGGCSPDDADRADFSRRFGVPSYANATEALHLEKPNIVSICSPTTVHAEQVALCLREGVPMVWLEKPPAANLAEARELCRLYDACGGRTTIVVNYQRRYARAYQGLRDIYRSGALGRCRHVGITYSRGLATNGSHLLDVLFFIVGDDVACEVLDIRAGNGGQPSFMLLLADETCVRVEGIDLPYHDIDIVLTCERGRASVLHGGMTVRVEHRREHELFPEFYRLADGDAVPLLGCGGFGDSMSAALDDLIGAHEFGRRPLSDLASSLRTMEILAEVAEGRAR